MDLTNLPKITRRSQKRVGRGIGSGKGGHTSGRGTKGQKAHERVDISFEGTKFKKSFIKRVPLMRGKGRFKSWSQSTAILNLGDLADWSEKLEITAENLFKQGLIPEGVKVKILGDGEAKKAFSINVPISKQAAEKVIKAGGKINPAV